MGKPVMNENMRQFIAVLRSGHYTQGYGTLRQGNSFCANGVACDMYDSSQWSSSQYGKLIYMYARCYLIVMPEDVSEWLGLTSAQVNRMAILNDSDFSFDSIADWLETQFEHEAVTNEEEINTTRSASISS